jgi:hypothetical protein
MAKGWIKESARHALASKGIETAAPKQVYRQVNAGIEGTHFKINDKITAIARYEKTRNGFRHIADLYINGVLKESAKVTYINRTWESYNFQTVLQKLIRESGVLSSDEKKLGLAYADKDHSDNKTFNTIAMAAKMGDIFGQTLKEKNDWKARMLKAGLGGSGLEMPEDWESLDEETKKARLDAAIGVLGKKKEGD